MIRRILIPTDGSTCSERAVQQGLDLAQALGADVTFLFAVEDPAATMYAAPELTAYRQDLLDSLRAAGEDALGPRIVEVHTTLTPAGDAPVVFGDTKEGSFGMRLHPALRLKGPVAIGHIRNSTGAVDGQVWGKRAAWVRYEGIVEDEPVGAVLFDHPGNLRHPTWWHARDYGLVAANPFGAHDFEGAPAGTGDFELPAGERLELRWRVTLYRRATANSPADPDRTAWIERAYAAWAASGER